jgi:hypothetical protein
VAAVAIGAGELPMVAIPRIAREHSERLRAAPEFVLDDWAGAASVSLFTETGEGAGIPAPTTAYLFYDEQNLYAAVICSDETMSGRALARRYGEDITQDEAVQVLLGLGDGDPGKRIEVGGYEGAQGAELPPVAHFYEFGVNAAGSISRHYNETLLPEPGFAARVRTGPQAWSARFTIPLVKVGVTDVGGRTLYFNLFRFYRGCRYGFHYPGFGNYQPMPFAKALFLPPGQEERRSSIAAKAPAPRPVPGGSAGHPVELEYYPLARQVCARFPPDAAGRRATLVVKGTERLAEARLVAGRSTVVRLQLPAVSAPERFTAVARMEGLGEPLEKEFAESAVPVPEWYGTRAGSDYVDRKVPYPWSAPEVHGNVVKLAHAEIGFGPVALPVAAAIKGRPLLAGAVTVAAEAGGRRLETAGLGALRAEATRVLADSAPGDGIQARTMVDSDGFMVVRLRLQGIRGGMLDKLEVRVPLAPGVARYVNRGSVQDTLAIHSAGYSGNASELWVGNENVGIAFSYDRQCFFNPADGRQIEVLQRPDGSSELILRLVGAPGQVVEDEPVFQFFLQGTPFRAEPVPPLQPKVALWFEEWSDYQGYPDLKKLAEVKERAVKAHADGKLFFIYFSQCLAGNSPGFGDYRSEWVAPPERMWYQRAYDPGKGIPCYVSCFRGAAGDLLLDGFQRLATEGDVDGIYVDGPSYPFDCESIGHDCSAARPAVWDDDFQTGRILGQRRFLKRARGIFTDRGRKVMIWAHTGGGLNLGTLALCDIFYEGEQLSRYCHGYMIDPAKFVVGYSGKPFGFRTFLLPVLYFDAARDARVAGALGLLHDVETSFGEYKPAAQDLFFSLARQPAAKAVFYGYWAAQPHIDVRGDLPVSYYRGEREAMLVVGNVRYEGSKAVTVGLRKMFGAGRVDVLAYGGRNELGRDREDLEVTVEEGGLRLFRITPAGEAPDLPPEPEPAGEAVVDFEPVSAFRPEDWVLSGNSVPPPAAIAVAMPYLRASVLYSDEVVARFGKPLPRDFSMVLRVAFDAVFRLRIDEAVVLYDGWTPWSLTGFNTLDEVGVCVARPRLSSRIYPEVRAGKVVELTIICRDDRLTILYDGKFIADRMLPQALHRSHTVDVATWGGHWLGLDVVSIAAHGEPPVRVVLHPVR